MNRKKEVPYQCVRCDYTTTHKKTMRNHLYKRQKPCPAYKSNLVLTNEIKEQILTNHVYTPPAAVTVPVSALASRQPINIVNNYQQNNYLQNNLYVSSASLSQYVHDKNLIKSILKDKSMIEKLSKLIAYKEAGVKDLDEAIEEMFSDDVDRLDDDREYRQPMTHNDIVHVINKLTNIEFTGIENMTVLYDKRAEKFKIRYLGDWEEYLHDAGLNFIVTRLSEYYLSSLEVNLIRGLEQPLNLEQPKLLECLEHYYKFIAAFQVPPIIFNKTDAYILGPDGHGSGDSFALADKYSDMYQSIKRKLLEKEKQQMAKSIIKVIRNNHDVNERTINETIIGLIHADRQFLQQFVPQMLGSAVTTASSMTMAPVALTSS